MDKKCSTSPLEGSQPGVGVKMIGPEKKMAPIR
jgi:hypothetical protein